MLQIQIIVLRHGISVLGVGTTDNNNRDRKVQTEQHPDVCIISSSPHHIFLCLSSSTTLTTTGSYYLE